MKLCETEPSWQSWQHYDYPAGPLHSKFNAPTIMLARTFDYGQQKDNCRTKQTNKQKEESKAAFLSLSKLYSDQFRLNVALLNRQFVLLLFLNTSHQSCGYRHWNSCKLVL